MERVCFLLRVRPGAARRVPRAPPRGVAGDARRAARDRLERTTRCSSATTGCWSATSRPTTSRRRSAAMEATDVNARWQAEMAEFFELPSGERPDHAASRGLRGGASTLPDAPAYAAVDLGAESGRVVPRPRCDGARVDARRSCTASPTGRCGCRTACTGTCCALFTETLGGAARARGPLRRRRRRHLGRRLRAARRARPRARPAVPLPRRAHRRHDRARARARAAARAVRRHRHPDDADQHRLPAARRRGHRGAGAAERIALVPDLIALWLSGELANESTNASTTGLLDARTGELGARADRAARAARRRRSPATRSSPARRSAACSTTTRDRTRPVHAVASHDTASAFVAAPLRERARSAILSSGTWSLLGLELDAPVLDRRGARRTTSPTSAASTARSGCSRNVMGLWLVQECARVWDGRRLRRS